jgi:hypothetical protein
MGVEKIRGVPMTRFGSFGWILTAHPIRRRSYMHRGFHRRLAGLKGLGAVALVGLAATTATGWAAGSDQGPTATASANVKKQIKSLNRRIAALEARGGGAAGPPGAPGATNVVVRQAISSQGTVPGVTAECAPGERAVGGGGETTLSGAYLHESYPTPAGSTPTGWRATSSEPGDEPHQVVAYVVCARP